jgi:hypothetical protein
MYDGLTTSFLQISGIAKSELWALTKIIAGEGALQKN